MGGGYTVAIWLEPPGDLWPAAKPVQLQRDFRRRVAALTWARFAHNLIPWASRDFVVRGWDEEGRGELVVGDGEAEASFEDGGAPAGPERQWECVVCVRAGHVRVYVADAPPVSLCDRCARTRPALLATVRAARVARAASVMAKRR